MKAFFALAWAFIAICSLPEECSTATRFRLRRCYDAVAACASDFLRDKCPYTRWACRSLNLEHLVLNDTKYPTITGKCDGDGPGVFCKSEEKAKACKADQKLCRELGYWHF